MNKVLLSVDAFHQETIPLEPVKLFATTIQTSKSVDLKVHPAWLGGKDSDNIYNRRTQEILREFEDLRIAVSEGNDIFPEGNALKYLREYFDLSRPYVNQYQENMYDVRSICFSSNGDILGENFYKTDILKILEKYDPDKT